MGTQLETNQQASELTKIFLQTESESYLNLQNEHWTRCHKTRGMETGQKKRPQNGLHLVWPKNNQLCGSIGTIILIHTDTGSWLWQCENGESPKFTGLLFHHYCSLLGQTHLMNFTVFVAPSQQHGCWGWYDTADFFSAFPSHLESYSATKHIL